jgi:ketosteroid isomerase-like protein
MTKTALLFSALLSFAGAQLLAADNSTIRAEIEAAEEKWVAAFNNHDGDALADLYLIDAQSFQPDVGILKGQDAIRKRFKEMAKQEGDMTQTVKTLDVFSQGDLVTETGTWRVTTEDDSMTEDGTYWMVWQKKDGDWKVSREIWNSTKKKVQLRDSLQSLRRMLGTWATESEVEGKTLRASMTAKPIAGGSGISTEGTVWVDGKVADEWADLIFYRAESKTLIDVSVSRNEGHSSSDVYVNDNTIVFQESGFDNAGIAFTKVTELVVVNSKEMRLNQVFGFKGGKPIDGLMQDMELKRVD